MMRHLEEARNIEPLFPKQLGSSLPSEFKVLEEIGRGSFGSVRKVIHIPTSKLLVRKEIRYGKMNSKERQQLITECSILARMRHENIVEFYSWDHSTARQVRSDQANGDVLYLYMEYCTCGDLSQMISQYKTQRKYISEKDIWRLVVQILMALHKCHTSCDLPQLETIYDKVPNPSLEIGDRRGHLVIHRDLKPGNIFLTDLFARDNKRGGAVDYSKVCVKLGDFGLAKSLQSSIEFATTYVGTPYYMSPEVLMDQPYTPLSDIWSLGCVVYEMCALKVPFRAKNFMELQRKIRSGQIDPIPSYYSEELQHLVSQCINTDEFLRPSAFELLQGLQLKVARKSLQLELFERNLLVYERELSNIGEMLEKQARENERELAETRLQNHRDFDLAVERRARELLNGRRTKN